MQWLLNYLRSAGAPLLILAMAGTFGAAMVSDASAACLGTNSKTGKQQQVREIYKTAVAHGRRFIAEATFSSTTGQPLIIYYARFKRLPGYYQRFVRLHECCHHRAKRYGAFRDEIGANCCALRQMRLSRSGAARIKSTMIANNINSETAVDYAGQGVAFWRRTSARCPRVTYGQ